MQKIGIILLITNSLFADYFISFDFTSKNSKLTSYNFNCSRAMVKRSKFKKVFLFKIKTNYKNVNDLCKYQQNEIIKNLLKKSFHIYSQNKLKNSVLISFQKGVFLPKLFDIIIKNNIAYFYLKESR